MNYSTVKTYALLVVLQTFIASLVFSKFLSGGFYFAYTDIGSDTYFSYVPYAMQMARSMAGEGFTGWSFEIGLGSATALWMYDPFLMLNKIGGTANILPLRIWIYLLKISLGGIAMLGLVRTFSTNWQTGVAIALAYSFCGFVVINGQWDSEATSFVFFPLLLWGISRRLQENDIFSLPLTVALALICGVFFISVAVFLVLTFFAFVLVNSHRLTILKDWTLKVLPLVVCGYLLAAPALLPMMLQMMDSSRVTGAQGLFQKILDQSTQLNEWPLILFQIGGLFHKDLFGIGSQYQGYWNYLEGPGFYIGVIPLLIIPQLWHGTQSERKWCIFSLLFVALYFASPFLRYAAMGFAVPYFRVSTLWVSLILLLLSAKALDHILNQSINLRILAWSAISYLLLLAITTVSQIGQHIWSPHAFKILLLTLFCACLLGAMHWNFISKRNSPLVLIIAITLEIILIARPSYVENRSIVSESLQGYNDGTSDALQIIRNRDNGFFRIEKDYFSVSYADSLAQEYMGLKSYSFHSRGLVDFYTEMRLIPRPSERTSVNYTNWLPNMGNRFMLNSLLGIKYMIAKEKFEYPGFSLIDKSNGLNIYLNEFTLPLGFIQNQYVLRSEMTKLDNHPSAEAAAYRDITIINAAILEEEIPAYGSKFDLDALEKTKQISLLDIYVDPIKKLQSTGLVIEKFASNHITGQVHPESAGILIFSIPYNQGWTLKIDGEDTPLIRGNFGMLAAPIKAGKHEVELHFQLPGQRAGLSLSILGTILLLFFWGIHHRNSSNLPQH